jgi:uncharacterized protein (DUF58 family)
MASPPGPSAATPETFISKRWARWLDQRIPRRREVTLNQRRIFIFLSAQGAVMGLVLLALFIAGLNYANNLLLGLSFFLGSLVVVTIHHTYANLSGLRIVAVGTEPAFAGEKAGFRLLLESTSGRQHQSLWFHWGDAEAYVPYVTTTLDLGLYLTALQRGLFHPPRLKIVSYFPLGLLRAWTWLDLDLEALVYPAPLASDIIPTGIGRDTEGPVERVRGTDDFDGLRRYVAGDSLAHVSWRHLARGQGVLTKMYADELAGSDMLDWQYYSGIDIETRLSHLSWWVVRLASQDKVYGLRLPGREIAVGQGLGHRDNCLEALALFERGR